jgi:hypothetical protein
MVLFKRQLTASKKDRLINGTACLACLISTVSGFGKKKPNIPLKDMAIEAAHNKT